MPTRVREKVDWAHPQFSQARRTDRCAALGRSLFEILVVDRLGNARVQALNDQRRADRFMSGGFERTNHIGDVLGNGCKESVVTLLNGLITCDEIVPTWSPGATGRHASGQ